MRKGLFSVTLAAALAGCAQFSTTITETRVGTDGVKTVKEIKTSASTMFDSKSDLAKLNVSQGPRTNDQYIGLAGLNQSSSTTTNFDQLFMVLGRAVLMAATNSANR